MMTIVQYSIFLAVLIPFSALAVSRVEVPTSIQVIDASGHTIVSTATPQQMREVPRELFSIPKSCALLFTEEPATGSSLTGRESILSTRIESRRATLRTLVDELSFAPYLPEKESGLLKRHLLSFGDTASASPRAIECLTSLGTEFRRNGGADKSDLSSQITEILAGLQYGVRNLGTHDIEVPTNEQEALYAGDLLLSQCPMCRSLSIREDRVELDFLLPVQIFGRWKRDAWIHLLLHDGSVNFDAPWWLFLSSHPLSNEIQDRMNGIPTQKEGTEGMFLRAKQVVAILSP